MGLVEKAMWLDLADRLSPESPGFISPIDAPLQQTLSNSVHHPHRSDVDSFIRKMRYSFRPQKLVRLLRSRRYSATACTTTD